MVIIIYIFVYMIGLSPIYLQATFLEWQADRAYAAGDYQKARDYYEQAVSQDYTNTQALYNLAKVAYNQHDYKLAESALHKVVQDKKINNIQAEQAYFNLGDVYMQQAQYEQALDAYQKTLTYNAQNNAAKKRIELAKKLLEQKKQEQQERQEQQENKKQDEQKSESNKKEDQTKTERKQDTENKQNKAQRQESNKDQEGQKQEQQENKNQAQNKQEGQTDNTGKQTEKTNETKHAEQNASDKKNSKPVMPPISSIAQQNLTGQEKALLARLEKTEQELQEQLIQMQVLNEGSHAHDQKNW